jgi:hypothetical protein
MTKNWLCEEAILAPGNSNASYIYHNSLKLLLANVKIHIIMDKNDGVNL